MRYFIKNIFLFSIMLVTVTTAAVCIYFFVFKVSLKDCPPPNISDSYSYNDKMYFLRNKKADIISIGSSMSLNNLSSETITVKLGNESYLNLSSWGMSMKDNFLLLKTYSKINEIRTCIMASNLIDFIEPDKKIDYNILLEYLRTNDVIKYRFKYFSAKYYFENFKYSKKVKEGKKRFETLVYDNYGGVLLDSANFQKDEARWTALKYTGIKESQYNYLDSISVFCDSNKINLLFFESPYREGMYNDLKIGMDTNKISTHVSRVREIVEKHGAIFVNGNEKRWSDGLFVDAIHFNSKGAKLFTEYCLEKVFEKRGPFPRIE